MGKVAVREPTWTGNVETEVGVPLLFLTALSFPSSESGAHSLLGEQIEFKKILCLEPRIFDASHSAYLFCKRLLPESAICIRGWQYEGGLRTEPWGTVIKSFWNSCLCIRVAGSMRRRHNIHPVIYRNMDSRIARWMVLV